MVDTLGVSDPLADLTRLEGVPSATAAAMAAVDAVLRDRGLRVISADTQASARAAIATATAELTENPGRWLVGALRLSAELADLAPLIRVAPAQALARAHALLARGVLADDDLGRIVDRPGVAERLHGVTGLLTAPTTGAAIVLGAVVHAEVATVAPFVDGNGVVARAAEHLVLMATGVDPRAVIVVESGHQAAGAAYASGLRGYADGGVSGVRNWLLHCAQAVTRGAELSPARPRG